MTPEQEQHVRAQAARAAQVIEDQKALVVERARRHAKRTVDAEEQPEHPALRALTPRELYDRPQPDYIIDQLLPEGALAELVGDSESLKSFFAIHLGLAVAAELSDFFGLDIVRHGAVLYICAEGGGAFQFRLRAWGTAHDVDITTLPFYTIATPVNLRDATFQQQLRAIVASVRPILIIVDTLHRCLPGAEENSSKDLGEVVGFATRLQADSGAAVLFLHHPPKNDLGGRGRGSSALYFAADTELSAVVEGEENADGTKVVVVSVKKQKDDSKTSLTLTNRIVNVLNEQGRPMCYASGRAITSCILELATDEDRSPSEADRLAGQVVAFLRANPGATKGEIREQVKARTARLNEAIESLEHDKKVTHQNVKAGRVWRTEYSIAETPVEKTEPPF